MNNFRKISSTSSKLQTNLFKIDFPKGHKDNQSQKLKFTSAEYRSRECKPEPKWIP